MRLRNVLAAIASAGFLVALLTALRHPDFWGMTFVLGVVAAALLNERRRYGARGTPTAGAAPTDERFVDPETGRMMRVWFDPASGERSYVEDGSLSP